MRAYGRQNSKMAPETPPLVYTHILSVMQSRPSLGAALKIFWRYILGPKSIDFKKREVISMT